MPRATWLRGRHLVRWAFPAALALAALVYFAAQRRGTLLEAVLRDWAIGEVAGATDSVYQLSIGGVRLSLLPGRITFDSMRLVDGHSAERLPRRSLPRADRDCNGVPLDGHRHLAPADGPGCERPALPLQRDQGCGSRSGSRPTASAAAAGNPRGGVPFVRDSIQLPVLLPTIILQRTELPRVSLDYTRRSSGVAPRRRVHLERLAVQLRATRIDPSVPPEARRPLFSEEAVVTADTLKVVGGTEQAVMLGRLRASLTDSTLSLDSIIVGPPQSDAEWVKAQRKRTDLIRLQLDSARFQGVDYRRLGSIEGAILVRRATLHGFKLDVLSDKRLPGRSGAQQRRTPQQWVASHRAAAGGGHRDHRRRTDRLQRARGRPEPARAR